MKATAKSTSSAKAASSRTKMAKEGIEDDRAGYGCCRPLSPSGSSSHHIFRRYDGET